MAKPLRALVVDPSPSQRRAAMAALARAGLEASAAGDGLVGWEFFQAVSPDLLLTELALSGLNGLEFIRRCKSSRPGLRVLVLTAAAGDWVTAAAFAAGADQLLLKPVSWNQILPSVELMVNGLPRRLEALLSAHGAPTQRQGFRQTALCAALLAGRECEQLKAAYIQAAALEKTTPACVSKNVERFIKAFFAQGDPAFLALPSRGGPPSNRDFLFALARCATIPLESQEIT